MPLKIHFLTCYSSDHDKISMANANIDALYAGSLRINVAYVFLSNFTFYKWCVTKVAHCTDLVCEKSIIRCQDIAENADHRTNKGTARKPLK